MNVQEISVQLAVRAATVLVLHLGQLVLGTHALCRPGTLLTTMTHRTNSMEGNLDSCSSCLMSHRQLGLSLVDILSLFGVLDLMQLGSRIACLGTAMRQYQASLVLLARA